jgi:hypothetical protein
MAISPQIRISFVATFVALVSCKDNTAVGLPDQVGPGPVVTALQSAVWKAVKANDATLPFAVWPTTLVDSAIALFGNPGKDGFADLRYWGNLFNSNRDDAELLFGTYDVTEYGALIRYPIAGGPTSGTLQAVFFGPDTLLVQRRWCDLTLGCKTVSFKYSRRAR